MTAPDAWHEPPPGSHLPGLDGDQLVLVSSGIDIGSSTMHLAVSRLVVERDGGGFEIVGRELAYESPVVLTPYVDGAQIDTEQVERVFRSFYAEAGLEPVHVDTGVVILTGVALERTNARALGEVVASWGGHFLSVAAGDRLEGVLAAHGSGAVERSRSVGTVANVDIGGGTVKISWCRDGRVLDVQAFDIGTRLIAWQPESRAVQRLEPTGAQLVAALDLPPVALGEGFLPGHEHALTKGVAQHLVAFLAGEQTPLMMATARGSAQPPRVAPDEVVFSGGFAEYLLARADGDFSDLGKAMAAALGDVVGQRQDVTVAPVGIRATAIGAGQFTVQVSGITIHRTAGFPLPLRNLPVVRLSPVGAADLAEELRARLRLLELHDQSVAIALPWSGPASYERLRSCAAALADGVGPLLERGLPVAVVCDGDVARLLGQHLTATSGDAASFLVVDGIEVEELDFLDLGEPVGAYGAIPVTVKSLAFRDEVGQRPRAWHHTG
ncbi:ethanolamine ammonia-lyase reactivating factor EutA [Egicoccus sp. AB-alg2]|uniref:ethanolamine ammonia-lyase reactivating factor EutA n=1 Tax=Egicoccus sp. AB-alg2 TaxID=3242693 RepID=UPI00359CDB7D